MEKVKLPNLVPTLNLPDNSESLMYNSGMESNDKKVVCNWNGKVEHGSKKEYNY